MRVLFLNYEYPPLGGGAANATAYLLREYEETNSIVVDLVTAAPDDQQVIEVLGEDIQIHKLPIGKRGNLHHQSQKDLLTYSYQAYQYADKLLQANDYDVIHAFFGVPCGVLARRLGKKYGVPYIVSLRGADVPGYSERFRFLYSVLTPLIEKVWSDAYAVVANSEGLRELARLTAPQQEIQVIPNGVDTEMFHPDETRREEGKIVVTSGASRLTSRKGIRYLIEAVAILKDEYPELTLAIMGDGAEREMLETLAQERGIRERVVFYGRVPKDETYKHYQEASIFVLPSENEGMSNALLEGLATGLPILATVTGGTEELVVDGENGFHIEMKSSESIALKLRSLLEDKTLRERMGEVSRARALTMSWENVASQYRQMYDDASKSDN